VNRGDRAIALRLEAVEAAAWRDAIAAATPSDHEALGLRVADIGGACCLAAAHSDSLLANRVLGLGLDAPADDSVLDAVVAHYAGQGTGFAVNLCPFAEPAHLGDALTRRGLATFFHHLKWMRGPGPAPLPTRGAPRVEPTRDAALWSALAEAAFGFEPAHAAWSSRTVGRAGWTHFVAHDGPEPIALGSLFVQGELAWLGGAATLESHRRRGAHGALVAARMTAAFAQGARMLTLDTAPDLPALPGEARRNAERAGFLVAYERPSWIHVR
jgi:GNAT superfamily N-acetyltransferase